MGVRRRPFVLLGVLTGALAMALFLGGAERGAAGLETECAPKKLCISITDQTSASYSATGVDRFLAYSVRLYNGGTSNLVNVTSLTATWADTGASSKTSLFQDDLSDGRCDMREEDDTITCTTPTSLPSGGPGETYVLVFRTATDVTADDTTLTASATAKEQQQKTKGGNPSPNDAYVTESNSTPYEDNVDHDVSFAGGGIGVTLATSNARGQSSTLNIPADEDLGTSVFELEEKLCTGSLTCTGQLVTTVASGLSPLNLWITYVGRLPAGATESNIVVYHTRTGDSVPTEIRDACGGELFSSTVDADLIPCRRVKITRLPGSSDVRVDLDVWDLHNGDWRWG